MPLIIEMLQESCRKYAKKAALRQKVAGSWREYSYEFIWETSDQIAAGLAGWGLEAGEMAALLAPSSPAWLTAYLGILKSNAVAVPVDKELKHGELRHILADCGARVLFTEQTYLETVYDIADGLPSLEKIILMDRASEPRENIPPQVGDALAALVEEWRRIGSKYHIAEDDMGNFAELAEQLQNLLLPHSEGCEDEKKNLFRRLLRGNREETQPPFSIEPLESLRGPSPPRLRRQASDPAVILYTSGTTGRSKGAVLSHDNIYSNVKAAIEIFELEPSMHTLSFLPINHVFEQVAGIILPLSVGGTISFAESLRKIGDNLGEVKPNFVLGVPAVFRLLAERMSRRIEGRKLAKILYGFDLTRPLVTRKIREAFGGNPVFISGGAALDPVVASTLTKLGLNIYQGYGITETSPVISVETPRAKKLGTVGKPMPGIQVRIHEPNADGVGEIWTTGPNVMLGYHNNPEATREVLVDGWYRTGDLGRIDGDGFLIICGRVKNLIVTANGKNVYPEEIENEILNSPFVAEIMVYGHKVNNSTEEVYALIYPDQDALDVYAAEQGSGPFDSRQIEDIIRREILGRGKTLADYKRIKRFTIRQDEFPKTTTRKIKRFVVEADVYAES